MKAVLTLALVALAWRDNNPAGATVVFHIYKAPMVKNRCPPDSQFVRIVSTVTPQYSDTNVAGGASYCYAVSAVTSVESARSAVVAVKVPRSKWLLF